MRLDRPLVLSQTRGEAEALAVQAEVFALIFTIDRLEGLYSGGTISKEAVRIGLAGCFPQRLESFRRLGLGRHPLECRFPGPAQYEKQSWELLGQFKMQTDTLASISGQGVAEFIAEHK